jgi:hypothetical protein
MMDFLRAHGVDAGPHQRPIVAGLLSGLLATVPAGLVLVSFGSFQVAADQVMRLPRPTAAAILIAAFAVAGALYGLTLRRAANDQRGGWLFGAVFGFCLWIATPVTVLPLIGGSVMAAGRAATGFLACFLVWGLVAGGAFPLVHRPLMARFGDKRRREPEDSDAGLGRRLLRRAPRH